MPPSDQLMKKLKAFPDASAEDDQEIPKTPGAYDRIVFDLEGNRHVMSHLNAHDAIQHLGWASRQAIAKPAKAPDIRVLVSKKAPPISDAPSEEVSLSEMDQDELIVFAKEHFDMTFTKAVSKEDILAAILQEQQE